MSKTIKCDSCGSFIPSSAIKCSYCDFVVTKKGITGGEYVSKLSEALAELQRSHNKQEHKQTPFAVVGDPMGVLLAKNKSQVISTFNLPNDKENLIELFLFCDGNVGKKPLNIPLGNPEYVIYQAWKGKAKFAYNKLKRFEEDDEEIKKIITSHEANYPIEESVHITTSNFVSELKKGNKKLIRKIVFGFLILFLLFKIGSCGDEEQERADNRIEKLNAIELKIEQAIENKKYDYALILVNQLSYNYDLGSFGNREIADSYKEKQEGYRVAIKNIIKNKNNGNN
jgi:hypothetical protein